MALAGTPARGAGGPYAQQTRATLSARSLLGAARGTPNTELRAAGALAARLIREEQQSPGGENTPGAPPKDLGRDALREPPLAPPGTPSGGGAGGGGGREGRNSVRDLRALRQVSKNLKERLTAAQAKRGRPAPAGQVRLRGQVR